VASIQFNADGTVNHGDRDINDIVSDNGATRDGVQHGVRVQDSSLHRFQQNGGPTTSTSKTTQVQLHEASDKVQTIGGHTTDAKTAEYLAKTLPVAAEAQRAWDAAQAVEAQSEADMDKAAEIQNPIGREIYEEMRSVGIQHKAALIVSSLKGDARGAAVATQRLADVLQQDAGMVGAKVDILRSELSKQIQSVCASNGVSFEQFSAWADRHASDTAASCLVNHIEGGSPARAWLPLIRRYQGR
jgi:hypothetical protein